MKQSIILLGSISFLSSILVAVPFVSAQQGSAVSRPCPYNCEHAGIPKDHCRDWREGNNCYVLDTSEQARGRLRSPDEEIRTGEDDLLRDRSAEMERMRDAERRRRAEDALDRYRDYESTLGGR